MFFRKFIVPPCYEYSKHYHQIKMDEVVSSFIFEEIQRKGSKYSKYAIVVHGTPKDKSNKENKKGNILGQSGRDLNFSTPCVIPKRKIQEKRKDKGLRHIEE